MLVHDVIHLWHHYDAVMGSRLAVLEKIATGAIRSVPGHSTGITVHSNWKTVGAKFFTVSGYSISIQDWYTAQDACEC